MRATSAVLALGLLTALGGCSQGDRPGTTSSSPLTDRTGLSPTTSARVGTPQTNPNHVPPKTGPDFTLTAEDYLKEWKQDPKAADAKYTGKIVEVSGAVANVGPGPGSPQVELSGGSDGSAHLLCLTAEKEPWARVAPGQTIKIKGKQSHVLAPQVQDCQPVELGPGGPVPISAKDLAAEYAKDRAGTNARYKGKYLLVTGEVAAKDESYPNVQVQFKTGGDTKVVCHVDSLRYGDKVKAGQPLTVVGEFMYLKEPRAGETGLWTCHLVTGAK
jgi:hypothetical protein